MAFIFLGLPLAILCVLIKRITWEQFSSDFPGFGIVALVLVCGVALPGYHNAEQNFNERVLGYYFSYRHQVDMRSQQQAPCLNPRSRGGEGQRGGC